MLLPTISVARPEKLILENWKCVTKDLSLPEPWCATRTHSSQCASSHLRLRLVDLSHWLSRASEPFGRLSVAATFAETGGLARPSVSRLLGRLANLGGYQGSYGVSLPPQPGPWSGTPNTQLQPVRHQNFWQIMIIRWCLIMLIKLCYAKMYILIYVLLIIPITHLGM